jgi:hypothetical protein
LPLGCVGAEQAGRREYKVRGPAPLKKTLKSWPGILRNLAVGGLGFIEGSGYVHLLLRAVNGFRALRGKKPFGDFV